MFLSTIFSKDYSRRSERMQELTDGYMESRHDSRGFVKVKEVAV